MVARTLAAFVLTSMKKASESAPERRLLEERRVTNLAKRLLSRMMCFGWCE